MRLLLLYKKESGMRPTSTMKTIITPLLQSLWRLSQQHMAAWLNFLEAFRRRLQALRLEPAG
jgi:hypothetical protein